MDGSNIVFRSLHYDVQTQSFGVPREIFDVVDASNYVSGASATNALESNGILYFPDGTRYEIVESRVRAIIDRNGNRTSFIQATAMGGSSTLTSQLARFIRDSAGREYTIDYQANLTGAEQMSLGCDGVAVRCDRIRYRGEDGVRSIVIRWMPLANRRRGDQSGTIGFSGTLPLLINPDAEYVLAQIDLPNGSHWKFYYSNYGEVAKVVLPTGGAVEYDHGAGFQNANAEGNYGVWSSGQVLNGHNATLSTGPQPSWRPFIYRRLLSRSEHSSVLTNEGNAKRDGSGHRTTYAPYEVASGSGTGITVNVVDSKVVDHAHTYIETYRRFHEDRATTSLGSAARELMIGGLSLGYQDSFRGKEYHTKTGWDATWRTIDRGFTDDGPGTDARLCQETITHTNPPATSGAPVTPISRATLYFHDRKEDFAKVDPAFQFGNITHAYEYNYGKAPALGGGAPPERCVATPTDGWFRLKRTDYLADANYASGTTRILSLPKVSRVLSPGLGEVSKIEYSYDSATIQAVGSPTVHADYCFTSKAERGNLTRISKTRTDLSSVTAAGTGTQPAQDLEETLEYDCAGNLRKHTNARGKATEFSYDDDFGSTTIGLSSPFEPNEANYFSPHYSGLRSGAFLTKTTLPSIGGALASAYSISRKYDFYTGQARSEKSANELETTFSHADGLGRPKEMYRGAGQAGTIPAKTIFQYHDIPMVGVADGAATYVQVSQDQNSGGSPTAKEANYFDGLGRLVRTEMHGVEILSKRLFYYDGGLLLGEEVVPKIGDLGQIVSHDYDVLGRIARTKYLGSGSEVSEVLYSYGTAVETLATIPPIVTYTASTTKITDERGNIREIHRDAGDRIVRVVELNEFGTVLYTTKYAYDALDNLTEVDQGVQRRFFGYDSLKQLRAAKNPENGLTVYEYDATGNLTRKTDALGVTTTTTYDELDRPTHVDYSGSTPDVSYCYDGKFFIGEQCSGPIPGQRLQMTGVGNSVGYTNYSYDLAGRVVSSVQGIQGGGAYTFAYTYYHNDQLASMKYPTGKLASYTYDANRRLSQVRCQHPSLSSGPCAASNPIVAAYSNYGAHGSPKTISYGNGIVDQMVYNERAQVTSMAVKQGASGPELLKLEYSYTCPFGTAQCTEKNNGNVRGQKISLPQNITYTQVFTYDSLNRLASFNETNLQGGSLAQYFQYDQWGNRWVPSGAVDNQTPTAQTWFSSTTNRMTPYVVGNCPGGINGCYDAAGRQIQVDPYRLEYDAEGRVTAVYATVSGETGWATYGYDGQGRRVKKTRYGQTQSTYFVYNAQGELVMEYGGAASASTDYYTTDHLGSTRMVTNGSGAVVRRYDYYPFGEGMAAGANGRSGEYLGGGTNDGRTVKFTGKERDAETGLDYFASRYFSAVRGRFTSPDKPFADQHVQDPQSWNMYSYVRNNPLRYVDPRGQESQCLPSDTSCVESEQRSNAQLLSGLFSLDSVLGTAKGIINLALDTASTLAEGAYNMDVANGSPDTGFVSIPTAQYSNDTQAAFGTMAQGAVAAAALFSSGGTATAAPQTFQRVASAAEVKVTESTGLLRGGRPGENFFTNAASLDARRAQIRLGLDGPLRDQRITFQITDPNIAVSGPRIAKPGVTGTPGGGREFSTAQPTPVKIIRVDKLKK